MKYLRRKIQERRKSYRGEKIKKNTSLFQTLRMEKKEENTKV